MTAGCPACLTGFALNRGGNVDSRVVLMVDVGSVKTKFDFRHLGRGVCVCVRV